MTSPRVAIVSSSEESTLIFTSGPSFKTRSSSMDDSNVDYTSLLGLEDRKRRFSEDVVDMELKDSVRLQKLYRQIQRNVHCRQSKGGWVFNRLSVHSFNNNLHDVNITFRSTIK